MPAGPDVRGTFVAPAADAVLWWFAPPCRPVHKAPRMSRRMPAVVQYEAPELALPVGSLQVLPRPLKMAV